MHKIHFLEFYSSFWPHLMAIIFALLIIFLLIHQYVALYRGLNIALEHHYSGPLIIHQGADSERW